MMGRCGERMSCTWTSMRSTPRSNRSWTLPWPNRPMAVGGGAILACSYEAKKFGVRSGMSVGAALRLCPSLEVVGGHYSEYQRLSDVVFTICRDFTPIVEQISIDEAFLDVSGSRHLFGPPGEIAQAIRRRVREETGLAISAGVASTKFLAKVASQVAKPDGCIVVDPEKELEFLHPLPVELMWGVGPVTKATLADLGVRTIGQLAELDGSTAQGRIGRHRFGHLAALARNEDARPVVIRRTAGSVGSPVGIRNPGPIDRRDSERCCRGYPKGWLPAPSQTAGRANRHRPGTVR